MTRLLGSPQIQTLAKEQSVRGVMVRLALEQAEQAVSEVEILQIEKALQLLLKRFQAMGDDAQ
jgi:hypothetical protein